MTAASASQLLINPAISKRVRNAWRQSAVLEGAIKGKRQSQVKDYFKFLAFSENMIFTTFLNCLGTLLGLIVFENGS